MSKPFMYFPDSDTLEITIANGPVSETENAGIDGEHDNILFHYDDRGRITSITIDSASQAANLSEILKDQQNIINKGPSAIFTVSTLAKLLDISPRTIQKTIKAMSKSGIQVGIQSNDKAPIVLTTDDANKIERWRATHRPGRPKAVDI